MRMSELLNEVRRFELDEGFSPREIKMAIGIASDPRYAKGNMTGAVNAIEKMKKGLSKHPQVMAVLKRQNEDVDLDEAKMTTDITNDKKIFKDIEKMGVKVKNITPLSGNEKNSATITMVGTKNNINKVVDKYQMKHMMGVQDFDEDIDEAVSMAQQAAIAISKKEKGEKPKKEKDEGNEFGMALKSARDKGEKTFVVSGKKYNVTEEGEASRIVEPYRPEFGLDEAPKMTYALVGTDMKIYAIDSDEKNMKLNRRSLEKRFKDVSPLKIARLKTAQSIGDTVDKSQLKEETLGLDEISTFSRAHIAILKKTFDPMRDKRLGPKGQAKLSKIMDMIGDKKDALIDLFKADIPFVSQSAAAKLITKYNMKGDEINKLKEEVELDEAMSPFGKVLKKNKKLIDNDYDGLHKNYKAYVMIDDEDLGDLSTMESERIFISLKKNKGVAYPEGDITAFFKNEKDAEQFVKDMVFNRSLDRLDINLTALGRGIKQESIDEKYDLYHKDFSSAMQHAYSYAKSKMGITVDPKEIDSKVATGPKKPTEGKTNKYMLKGKGGNLQIQVYNKGGSKPFELNMYKEENNLIAAAVGHLSND